MDDLLRKFLEGLRQFGDRVNAVDAEQWTSATPDIEWTVADLVGHLVDEHRWTAPLLAGHDLQTAGEIVKAMSDTGDRPPDLAGDWSDAAIRSADAVLEPGALDRTVDLSRGPTPARSYLAEMVFDLTVHSWDLGTAIGYSTALPDDLVEWVYRTCDGAGDLTATGLFDAPKQVADDAPTIHKLVAATGRSPR